ncbi:MAG: NCS2 family permease [Planctomycetes bacterium]|nr:NCS2 family permease [Planctomycetota bacterium]
MFQLRERGSSAWAEVRGGVVTYLTLSYILFVQPAVLSVAGMPPGDVFVATCVASAVACFLMGLLANYPIALAPAMGHNFFFVFTVCLAMKFTWEEALAANVMSGAFFLFMTVFGLREAVMNAVPEGLKYAIANGIGLLIAFVGLQYGGLVQNHNVTLVRLGDLTSPIAWVVLVGIALTAGLMALRFKGAVLVGIVGTAVLALAAGHVWQVPYHRPDGCEVIPAASLGQRAAALAQGKADPVKAVPPEAVKVVMAEPAPLELPRWPSTTLFAADGSALFRNHRLLDVLVVIFILFFLDLFDTVGTLIGVGERAGFLDAQGRLPRARQALFSDACGTVVGALMGTSTITSYVESAAGVASGARTGLAAVVVGALMLASLVLAPLVQTVGAGVRFLDAATGAPLVQVAAGTADPVAFYPVIAPVLVVIGAMMMGTVRRIRWDEYDEAVPAFLTIVVMQFSFSITDGIAWGFISYTLLKLVTGRARELHWMVALFAGLFVLQYAARAFVTGG